LTDGWSCSSSYSGGFPGNLSVDGGYSVRHFGNDDSGTNGYLSCISPGAANWGDLNNGNNRAGTVYASYYSSDPDRGIAWYRIDSVRPDNQPAAGSSGIQYLGASWLAISWNFPYGYIEIYKSSMSPDVTDGNSCYSLEGIWYGIYGSHDNAQGQSNAIAWIQLDASGYGWKGSPSTWDGRLDFGTYYLREWDHPDQGGRGYQIDQGIHVVTVNEQSIDHRATVILYLQDAPTGDPFLVMLQKIDIETGGGYGAAELPQGSANLVGAEYTVRYYQEFYHTVADAQAVAPTRTWIIGTNAQGYSILDACYLGGDPLYYSHVGSAMIPFGTVTVEETKAPAGYLLPQPGDANYRVFLTRYVPDQSTPQGLRIEGDGSGVIQGNEPKHPEQIIRGDLEFTKQLVLHTPDGIHETGITAPEPGATFDFYASRDFTGMTPHDGTQPAFSLTTDADGRASTIAANIFLIQNPEGSYTVTSRPSGTAGGLPFDSYLCIQRTTDPAFEKCAPRVFTIEENRQVLRAVINDTVIPAAIQVVKRDAETGAVIPYPATWQVYSKQTESYVSMSDGAQTYNTFTSDENGHLILPEQLPYGSYLLHELKAPGNAQSGYLLNEIDVPFQVSERHDFDTPLVVEMHDIPAKGIITITKTAKQSQRPVPEAVYSIIADGDISTLDGTLRAVDGETVATLLTDNEGKASSMPLYLGNYLVKETTAPDGYLPDPREYRVELSYADQLTALVQKHLDMVDTEVFLEVLKLDKDTNEPVSDTEFSLYRETTFGSGSWELVEVLVTDKNGRALLSPIIQGSYKLVETCPNPAYKSCEESGEEGTRFFTIDETSTSELQVFYDEKIQLSCEIYEDTINITSAGFRTSDEDYLRVENVGSESYHYTLDFRSTSNVRADEFTVVDSLESVVTGNVRLQELFTPIARGDSDGYFNLWYQTNYTDITKIYSLVNAMSTNPFNANNPDKEQRWSSVGWMLWRADIPTTETLRLTVQDLGLAANEYITALRFEYGSVEVGFTTRDACRQALQISKELKPTISDWNVDKETSEQQGQQPEVEDEGKEEGVPPLSVASSELRPATYLVTCSTALLPPAMIRDMAVVNIARNVVLSDVDRDAVRTTVIEPFMVSTSSTPPTDLTTLDGFGEPRTGYLPSTGDSVATIGWILAILLSLSVYVFALRRRSRSSPSQDKDCDGTIPKA
jgi:hypothetical protein